MKERILAVLAAGCLVALALVARSALSGDDGDRAGERSGTSAGGGTPTVACSPDLVEICDALAADGHIAADPPTLDLSQAPGPPGDVDGWITWDPAPRIANYDSNDPAWDEAIVLGTAPLGVVGSRDELALACGREVAWSCVVEAVDGPLPLAVGVGDPRTADGIARLAPLARSLLPVDRPTDAVAPLQLVVDSPVGGQRDARTMATALATQPGAINLVVGPEPVLAFPASTERGRARGLQVVVPEPEASATVVLAARTGRDLGTTETWCDRATEVLEGFGLEPCTGTPMDDDLAGLLYQVRRRIS